MEIDLWYRSDSQRREKAISTLVDMVEKVDGKIFDFIHIPEIKYQGVLVSVPAKIARQLTDGEGVLARLDDVMTIRPQSGYVSTPSELSTTPELGKLSDSMPTDRCIAALLDGYPVAGHEALSGRLIIHEVDVTSSQVPVVARFHGTAMASLILHGDFQANQPPLNRKIAVIPVLASAVNTGLETTPYGKLPIGVIYRSVKAIIGADKSKFPDLEHITIINHSICDTFSPFVRRPSPWASLLDYFSHTHRLLFVISAGNISESFPVNDFQDIAALHSAPSAKRQAAILIAIEKAKARRNLLNPAESINSLTVGAIHADGAGIPQSGVLDPYPDLKMTNLASAVGFGVNRSLKPDLVEHGGRFAMGCSNRPNGGVDIHAKVSAELGHLVAAPSVTTGNIRHVMRNAGTSNAAALTTRTLLQIADAVEATYEMEKIDWLTLPTRVPILKALVGHGCAWDRIGDLLEDVYPPREAKKWFARRDTISKFLGYGRPAPERIVNGAENRITLLADDSIFPDELHEYRIPLPSSMLNTKEVRSITITLAWTSPIVITSADYRGVGLKIVNSDGKSDFWDGVDRSPISQPNGSTTTRGTLIHLRLEGKKIKTDMIADGIFIGVQAMARHDSVKKQKVPYALAVTLEVAAVQKTGLYVEVQDAIRLKTGVRSSTRIKGQK